MQKTNYCFFSLFFMLVLFCGIFLTACGGGGGGGSNDPIENPDPGQVIPGAPVAEAGPDQEVFTGEHVTLSGNGSVDNGTIAAYNWIQIGGKTTVELSAANTRSPTFTATEPDYLRFQLTVTDDQGRQATDSVDIRAYEKVYSTDFSAAAPEWKVQNNTIESPSWHVSGGALLQSNSVANHSSFFAQSSYHLGTYSYLDANTSPELHDLLKIKGDYKFSVDVTPLEDSGDINQGNDVGVMFRYADDDNYYRFSMSSRYGFSRLEKRVQGQFTPLLTNGRGYVDTITQKVTIEVNQDLIIVSVDGETVFSTADPSLQAGTVALYCQDHVKFDNVLITGNNPGTILTITSPQAYSIEGANSDELSVQAAAVNAPENSRVRFTLDNDQSKAVLDSTAPFSAVFPGVAQGEHEIEAVLMDASGSQVLASDRRLQVGIRGEHYIAVGDSITNGKDDNYANDNMSEDGRIIAHQGYAANLNDLLTISQNNPNFVANEGIGGDKSEDVNGRINSIMSRNSNASKALVLVGTNDALSNVTATDYRSNIVAIMDTIIAGGKQPYVAKIPPIFNLDGTSDTIRNSRIENYNHELSSLSYSIGPDFYRFFLGSGKNRSSLYANDLHFNGLGYLVIAHLWHNVLSGASDPQLLPFGILENLQPLDYKQNLLEAGDRFYIDMSYELTDIPAEIANGIWIMTELADRANTSPAFLRFEIDRDYLIYVAYDASAQSLPNWLAGFENTGLNVNSTNGTFNLFSKPYSNMTVELPGNRAEGGNGENNYFAIAVAQ